MSEVSEPGEFHDLLHARAFRDSFDRAAAWLDEHGPTDDYLSKDDRRDRLNGYFKLNVTDVAHVTEHGENLWLGFGDEEYPQVAMTIERREDTDTGYGDVLYRIDEAGMIERSAGSLYEYPTAEQTSSILSKLRAVTHPDTPQSERLQTVTYAKLRRAIGALVVAQTQHPLVVYPASLVGAGGLAVVTQIQDKNLDIQITRSFDDDGQYEDRVSMHGETLPVGIRDTQAVFTAQDKRVRLYETGPLENPNKTVTYRGEQARQSSDDDFVNWNRRENDPLPRGTLRNEDAIRFTQVLQRFVTANKPSVSIESLKYIPIREEARDALQALVQNLVVGNIRVPNLRLSSQHTNSMTLHKAAIGPEPTRRLRSKPVKRPLELRVYQRGDAHTEQLAADCEWFVRVDDPAAPDGIRHDQFSFYELNKEYGNFPIGNGKYVDAHPAYIKPAETYKTSEYQAQCLLDYLRTLTS